ncbi:MAG: glycoside hydrolase family 88 protein [Kiritimatiellae bacterium]|nr:glycoside hydrolase family 88 protein [Kiritimatiellia bacterium]
MMTTLLLATCIAANPFTNWPTGSNPETIGRKVVEQFLSAPPEAYAPKGANAYHGEGKVMPYAIVSLWVNAIDFALTIGDKNLIKRLTDHFEPFFDEKIHLVPVPNHVDFSVFGALPYAVYRANGDVRCLDLGEYFATTQWAKPLKGAPPRFVHGGHNLPWEERLDLWKRGYTAETRFWIDDMYMITLLQTEGARATGKSEYVERAAKEAVLYLEKLQKPNGLFEHGLKAPFYWCRGNGWVAGGMTLILKNLSATSQYREPIMAGYRRMMAELLKLQKPDGLWAQLVNEPEVWSETSGSAMFTSAMVTGVKRGWLDATTYGPAARRAYLALLKHLDAYGNIDEVCMGTGAHDDHAFYLARPRKIGDAHGQAALMWTVNALLTGNK